MKLLKNIITFAPTNIPKMKRIFLAFFVLFCVPGAFAQAPDFNYTQTCFGSQTTLVASSSLPDSAIASWKWDLDGNGTYELSGKTIISLITLNDTVAVKLKITPNAGSADSVTKNVIIDPMPQVNFMVDNLCESKAATYASQSTIISGSITQFLWDFNNDGTTDDNSNDTVNFTCGPAQVYFTRLTCVSNKGCSAFAVKTTQVYPNPIASFTASPVCEGTSTTLLNTSTAVNPDFYLWNFGDGNNNATSGNTTHTYTTSGTYTVNLIAVTQSGCRDTMDQTVIVNAGPTANALVSPVCIGSPSQFSDLSASAPGDPISMWSWNFGDGSANSAQMNPTYTYTAAGTYNVTDVVTSVAGCKDSVTITHIVSPLPIISITPIGNTTLESGQSVVLSANGGISYLWNTGSAANNITVTQTGVYSVTGMDANGCSASDSVSVTVHEILDTVVVSGFILTPNEDGINDALVISNASAFTICELTVYNMWNDKVYSINDYKNDWKGTDNSGAELSSGAYYYIITCDDKPMLKGNINILR